MIFWAENSRAFETRVNFLDYIPTGLNSLYGIQVGNGGNHVIL